MHDIETRMGDPIRNGPFDRDVDKAITALKKGAHLLKYGRRGKPKFCPFRLSVDESILIWYVGKVEKQLRLSNVSKIIPGQRTAIFQRYPQPDKEYQSFSLIYGSRSLDLICKDKDEAEVWFVGLKALISHGSYNKRLESRGDRISGINGPNTQISVHTDISEKDSGIIHHYQVPHDYPPADGLGKVFSDAVLCTTPRSSTRSESVCTLSSCSSGGVDNANGRSSGAENFRESISSAISSSSHGSLWEDADALSDIFIWGEVVGDVLPGGALHKAGSSLSAKVDVPLPKAFDAAILLDVQHVGCGSRHAALVTKHGEVYSWGEGSGGRLGHGVDAIFSHPKHIDHLDGMNIKLVACGEYHTCAVTCSGHLYTWGDGVHNSGLLGHGTAVSHWIPKLVHGPLEGVHVSSVSCGPWHTAILTSTGQLFTFGDGLFGALGHGDNRSINIPREVESLRGSRTVRAACGVWHTAAIVEIMVETENPYNCSSGKLFTWGDGDKGRLGHGDEESRLVPASVTTLADLSFCQVACGQDITVALTTSGQVYTVGRSIYGQLGNSEADGKFPTCVEGKLHDSFVDEIACGSYHVAVLTSRTEVYTWGKGENGRLGHGDNDDRHTPTLVEALKGKQVKKIVCGPDFTAAICLHKWVCSDDLSVCSGCHLPFGFRRKQHNCYNCGLAFCKLCSSRKSVKAALAPNIHKLYRVCDECYAKLKKITGSGTHSQIPKHPNGSQNHMSSEPVEKESALSRLSSFVSFKGENGPKSETNISRPSCTLNESFHWGSVPTILGNSRKVFHTSGLGSRVASRSTSPVSSMPSPSYSSAAPILTCLTSAGEVVDHSRRTYHCPSEGLISLHLQVEDLTHKSQLLESELERTLRQFRNAATMAEEESVKCRAAKEVIKSLTSQLNDMAERVAEGFVIDSHGTLAEEWVQQDEPGVFVTSSPNPGGRIFLRRVCFSKNQFNEQQAEQWWTDNRSRLELQYIFPDADNYPTASEAVSKNEMVD